MPAVLSTVKSVSAPEKSPAQKAPPIPTQQRKEKFVERQERHGRLTMVLVSDYKLSKRFDKKPRYFLDIFFLSRGCQDGQSPPQDKHV
ncbi:hypothetical protein L208DRAFT_1403026 [Tricholoma matsutake]|nr:hypothetical protein L208DRAFT_1403026 [Tricholoma matsutake 945]